MPDLTALPVHSAFTLARDCGQEGTIMLIVNILAQGWKQGPPPCMSESVLLMLGHNAADHDADYQCSPSMTSSIMLVHLVGTLSGSRAHLGPANSACVISRQTPP